jgi:Tfp pilus assembly protein PilN
MTQAPKPDAICMGISVEGDHLRLAAVGREGKTLRVLSLADCPVPVAHFVPAAAKDDQSDTSQDPFEGGDTIDTTESDYSAVREFLQNHYIPGASLAVSLGEPYVRTFLMPAENKDNPARIVKRILTEVQQSMNMELSRDRISYHTIGKSGIVASIRLDSAPILEVCTMPFGSQRRGARIDFLTSNDIALINLVRVHFRVQDQEIVHVINVAKEETRLYILQGYDLKVIAPTIQQGANDRDYVMMLNNRIELAAEHAGYPKADAVVFCGYAEEIGLKDEILANNPTMVTHSLSRLRVSYGNDEAILKEMRHYSVPISIAWQKLQKDNKHFYRMNLLPTRIREEQKKLKLAWHGFILLVIGFVAVAGMTFLGMQKQEELSKLKTAVTYEQKQVREQQVIVDQINALEGRSASIITATNTLDTLLLNSEKWSETLDTLARGASGLQSIWIHEFKPDPTGTHSVIGFSGSRAAVPSLAQRIGQTNMKEITVQKIADRKVFRYDVNLTIGDQYPHSGSVSNVWHDSVGTALGAVDTRLGASAPTATTPAAKSAK